MAKYLVRIDATYSKLVEAESEDDAIIKAPDIPPQGEWDTRCVGWEVEEG